MSKSNWGAWVAVAVATLVMAIVGADGLTLTIGSASHSLELTATISGACVKVTL